MAVEPNEDVLALREAWRNEKCGPSLMPIDEALVNRVLSQVETQERNVELQWEAAEESDSTRIMLRLQQVEIERIRFIVRSYLRTRIRKIEEFATHYLQEEQSVLLTPSEAAYAKRFVELATQHYHNAALDHIPDALRSLETQTEELNMVPAPNNKLHVFIRVKEDIGPYIVDPLNEEETTIPLEAENVLMIPYEHVKPLVESHQIELI